MSTVLYHSLRCHGCGLWVRSEDFTTLDKMAERHMRGSARCPHPNVVSSSGPDESILPPEPDGAA